LEPSHIAPFLIQIALENCGATLLLALSTCQLVPSLDWFFIHHRIGIRTASSLVVIGSRRAVLHRVASGHVRSVAQAW